MRLVLLSLAIVVGTAHGQTRGRIPRAGEQIPLTIAAAEHAAARYPKPANDHRPQAPNEAWVGTAERRCVSVGAHDVVRSGDFVVGPFSAYPMVWQQGFAKLWWIPMQTPAAAAVGTGPSLVVYAVRIDSTIMPVVVERETLARPVRRLPEQLPVGRSVQQPLFYPSSFRLPTAGEWMLVAQAGANWGWFRFRLPAAG